MTASAGPRRTLPSRARLHAAREFSQVYQRGLRATGGWLTLVLLRRSDRAGPRLGVSVSKDHGAAVRRNAIKRRLREAFRLERHQLPSDCDLVLIPRPREEHVEVDVLRQELVALVQRVLSGKGKKRRPPRGE